MKSLAVLSLVVLTVACAEGDAVERSAVVDDTSITVDGPSLVEGRVRFVIENAGTEIHEFEIFAGASAGQVLPVSSNVADTTGLSVVDEIENLVPNGTATLTVDLSPGTYLVLCNLPGHYAQGMSTTLTVTPSP